MVPLRRRLGERDGRRVLAATAHRHGPRTVWIDWPGMLWLAGFTEDSFPPARPLDKRRVGLALGRVLAHELIHALLPDRPHADAGLMSEAMRQPLLAPVTVDEGFRAALHRLAPGRATPTPPTVLAETAGP